ncbi:MAG TPA: erythromycin esterase family protein [Niastella sp.]|nr:erythromycin esterase family protein [Niastella sp.]
MYSLTIAKDLDALINAAGERMVVMLGEASHGTHEYYTWRTAISKRLIEEHGFNFIAVEGDWPDCYKINRYVKRYKDAGTAGREKYGNYVPTVMSLRYDAFIFLHSTKALHPLHLPAVNKIPETYPFGV